ncbi:MAG: aminotransferase class III-fold pyridoxal phosphate-dependent enzyme [Candidatus Bathyarchaeia archaeon]
MFRGKKSESSTETVKHDVLLIFDEVITSFRGAPGGAQEYYGVEADVATFAKAIANGYPIAAVVGKKDILEVSGPDTKNSEEPSTPII